jgi:hypothetical protein
MKNIYEVLRQKEMEMERIKMELQALRIAAPLLDEEPLLEPGLTIPMPPVQTYPAAQPKTMPITQAKSVWP